MRFFIGTLILLVILFSLQQAEAGTTISLGNTIDIPHRTVAYEGKTYEIQDIGAYSPGENINITVDSTEIKSFQLSLLDRNKSFLWNHMVYYTEGKTSVVMPAGSIAAPGTYAFAVVYQGEVKAVKPVVISSYKLTVTPSTFTVAPGGALNVKVSVVPDTAQPVKAALVLNSSTIESAAHRTGEGAYEAQIKIPVSAHGKFSLYAGIATNDTILGYPELIGVSSGGIINVAETSPSTSFFDALITFIFVAVIIVIIKMVRK